MAHKLTLSVSQLNEYVRRILQLDPMLHGISLRGEISNLKFHQSGMLFFTLKDEGAAISCVMNPQGVQSLQAMPFDGMKATVSGNVGLYARGGQYQFYADSLQVQGVGVLYERLIQLKAMLASEGLFDRERKRPLPRMVDTVGVVSSPTGAVIHDIMSVSLRRDPQARILLCPVSVQGVGAADEVAHAIDLLDRLPQVSVIIVARGGGSIEDLWTFNEEIVVRAVAACQTPIVSAVGHETDVTLCDLAADFRAPTPSAAAECVVAERQEMIRRIEESRRQIRMLAMEDVQRRAACVAGMRARISAMHPSQKTALSKMRLDALRAQLSKAAKSRIELETNRLCMSRRQIELLSPYHVLSRGYAIVSKNGRTVTSCEEVTPGDKLSIRMSDGSVSVGVLGEQK